MAIRSFELEPTRENLLNTLTRDLLERNKSVWQFARFCDAQEGKCSIAIDAKWGQGKTFFVRHVQMLLEAFNEFSDSVSEEERATIKRAFSGYIRKMLLIFVSCFKVFFLPKVLLIVFWLNM